MIERAREVVAAPKAITMVRVQAMIQDMMAEQWGKMRQMLLNRDEPTMPVEQPELNEGQLEEGNYSRTVGPMNRQRLGEITKMKGLKETDASKKTSRLENHQLLLGKKIQSELWTRSLKWR